MSDLSQFSIEEFFQAGNYATVAMKGSQEEWQTYAALGLIGKTQSALEGLSHFNNEEAYFYSAVASWIEGDEDKAAHILETIPTPHAQNLLTLIRKPQIHVLAQLPWSRSGSWDLFTAAAQDRKFQVRNVSFHLEDLPNRPYADVHEFYDRHHPPDFYICQMVEWHLIPPNLQQLPCPIFGQTGDYDLHIQVVYPWLQLFDEILVTDQSEWQDVRQLVKVPVSTFPKAFGVANSLPPVSQKPRELDLFLSGTVTHPYHPDKAQLLHQILQIPELKSRIINGFQTQTDYWNNLLNTKVCFTYIRHSAALPTRGIEALSMGCAVVVQKDSVLTLFVGEEQGVLTYNLESNNLALAIQRILGQWSEFEQRAKRGAELIRQEFSASQVASQYLRFLTFLAAKPRSQRQIHLTEQLVQKRPILQKGWLPSYDFSQSPLLKQIGMCNHAQLQTKMSVEPVSTHLFIDLARESVLYNYHRALYQLIPVQEWLATLTSIYKTGLSRFPQSLVLRFNFIRVILHFGQPAAVSEALKLLGETLCLPVSYWQVDVMEDVFPWDFCSSYFNYRQYFDLITTNLTQGKVINVALCQLILASLHYYKGFYCSYQGYYSQSLNYFKQATILDPGFSYYKLHYAKQLIERSLPEDCREARVLLTELATSSIVFSEALKLLKQLQDQQLLINPQLEGFTNTISQSHQLEYIENISDAPLQPDTNQEAILRRSQEQVVLSTSQLEQQTKLERSQRRLRANLNQARIELKQLQETIQAMESSKFWRLRKTWFRLKRAMRLTKEDL